MSVTTDLDFDPKNEMFDPFQAETIRNPYPWFERLRAADPVHQGVHDLWFLTRYTEIDSVLTDHRLFVRGRFSESLAESFGENSLSEVMSRFIFALDPPDHTRLRRLVSPFFTRKSMERLRSRIWQVTSELLDNVRAAGGGSFDLIGDFAMPLPIQVICEILGVPVEDRDLLRQWTCDVTPTVDPAISEDVRLRGIDAAACFKGYFTSLISYRRRNLQDDLISELIQANESGDALSRDEMITMFVTLLIAGHENITNLIGNGILAFLQNPGQLQLVREDPGLVENITREVLRYDSPTQYVPREVSEDTVLGGKTLRKGATVMALLGSANRDEERFTDAGTFDLRRENLNDQVDFGKGPAFCIGAPLTLIEGEVAFRLLLERLPGIRLGVDPSELQWRPTVWARGLVALPVQY